MNAHDELQAMDRWVRGIYRLANTGALLVKLSGRPRSAVRWCVEANLCKRKRARWWVR